MGYEVIYSYHEKVDGNYNKDEVKTIKKKVGDPFEDVPLEKLASVVMGQLARRDIFVASVEVFELSKKPISYRESDGGVVIKNKKFTFDHSVGFSVQDLSVACIGNSNFTHEQVEKRELYPHEQIETREIYPHEQLAIQKQTAGRSKKPVATVVFSPELPMLHEVKTKGYKLTVDKKYPVYAKSGSIQGEIYTIIDDLSREIKISDKYFIQAPVGLIGDNEVNFSETQKDREGGKLFWGNASQENMPNIRR